MDNRYSDTGTPAATIPPDLLRCVYLERLQRLADLRADPENLAHLQAKQLVDSAMYSTYQDCVNVGMRTIARRILGLPRE